jgi:signal peptidase I
MAPTIRIGDKLVLTPMENDPKPIERFEIVAVNATAVAIVQAQGKSPVWVHRIIGLPGETVELRKGVVFVDGKELSEPFEVMRSNDDFGPVTIPLNEYFLLGDNRGSSYDSRSWRTTTVALKDIAFRVKVEKRK